MTASVTVNSNILSVPFTNFVKEAQVVINYNQNQALFIEDTNFVMTIFNTGNTYYGTASYPLKLDRQKAFIFQSMNRVGTVLSIGIAIYQIPFQHKLRLTFPSQISLQANCLNTANFSYPSITDCEPQTANGKNYYFLKNIFERLSFYNDYKLVNISLNVSNFGGQGSVLVDLVGDAPAADAAINPNRVLSDSLSFLVV